MTDMKVMRISLHLHFSSFLCISLHFSEFLCISLHFPAFLIALLCISLQSLHFYAFYIWQSVPSSYGHHFYLQFDLSIISFPHFLVHILALSKYTEAMYQKYANSMKICLRYPELYHFSGTHVKSFPAVWLSLHDKKVYMIRSTRHIQSHLSAERATNLTSSPLHNHWCC